MYTYTVLSRLPLFRCSIPFPVLRSRESYPLSLIIWSLFFDFNLYYRIFPRFESFRVSCPRHVVIHRDVDVLHVQTPPPPVSASRQHPTPSNPWITTRLLDFLDDLSTQHERRRRVAPLKGNKDYLVPNESSHMALINAIVPERHRIADISSTEAEEKGENLRLPSGSITAGLPHYTCLPYVHVAETSRACHGRRAPMHLLHHPPHRQALL